MENERTQSDLVLSGRRTIEKEARALAHFVNRIDEDFARACEMIYACRGTVLLTGMGKSGLVARKWSATFSGTGTKSYFINPAEARHGDLGIIRSEDLLVALSYSGETDELGAILRHSREIGIPAIGVTGDPASSLARQSTLLLSVELSEEACPLGLAPTTSTTLMMALGDAIAVALMQKRGFTGTDFARLHPGGSLGRRLWLRVSELMHKGDAIPVVRPDDSMEHVLIEMTRKFLGLAVVKDGEKVLGIITDGDLRRFFQRNGIPPSAIASEIMTTNPKRLPVNSLAIEAREIMERNKVQQLLIDDENGQLAGVIHLYDLMRAKVM